MDSYGFDVEDGDDDSGCERGSKGRSPCERGDPILPDKCMPENDSSVANSSLDSGCGCLFNASDHSYSLMRLYEDVTDTSPSLTEADPSSEKIKKESEVKREIQRSVSDSHGFSISETSEKVCYHQVEGTEACLGSNSVLACEDKEEFSVSNDDLPTTTDYEMHAEVQTKSTEVQAVASKMQSLASLSDPSCLQNSKVGESFGSSLDSLTEKSVVSSKEQNVFESTGLLRSETDEDNTPRRRNGIESSKSVGISTSNGSSSYVEESNQEKMESFVIIPSDDEQDYLYDESDTDSHCEKTEGVHRGNGNQACEDAKDTPCLCSRGEEIREFDKTEGFKKSDTERSEATSNHNKNDCTESEEVKESAGAVPNIAKSNASTSDLSNTDACEVRSTGFVQATTSSLLCLGRSHTVNRRPPKRRINREEKTDATKGCNSVSSLELNTPEDDVVLIKKHVAPELLEIEDEIIAKSCPSDIYDYSTDTKNSLYEDDVIFEQEILSDAETKLVRQILELCRVFIDTVDTADPNWCQKLKYGVLQQLKFLIVGTKNAQFEQERLMKRRILLERGIKMRKEALEARQRRKAPVTQPSLSSPSVPCAGSDFDNPPCLVKEVKAERSQNTSVNCCPKSFEDNQFHPVVVDQVQGQRDATFDKFSRGVRVIHMKGPLDPSVRGRFEGPSTTRKIFGPSSNNNIAFTGRLVSLTGPEGSRRLVRIIRRPANGSVVAMK
ncbi:hypothetical protein AB6A40_004528 [Gnathostoma spinigerum]|uniref:Uncharacterized protein n=1 Tax=Gnathostoma spinigerum TaxID=75299 RepID=A0ABD6ECQ6_9BILA